MNNQGLEALAALASAAQAPAPQDSGLKGDEGELKAAKDGAGNPSSSAERVKSPAEAVTNTSTSLPAHLVASLQTNSQQQQLLQHQINLQQHQQQQQQQTTPTALAASSSASAGANTGSLSPELALIQQLQRSVATSDPSVAMAAMQNVAYYQALVNYQNQAAVQKQQNLSNPGHLASLLAMGQQVNGKAGNHPMLAAAAAGSQQTEPPTHLLYGTNAAVAATPTGSVMPPPPRSAPASPAVAAPQSLATAPPSRGPAPPFPRSLLPKSSSSVTSAGNSTRSGSSSATNNSATNNGAPSHHNNHHHHSVHHSHKDSEDEGSAGSHHPDEKKELKTQLKRAANRRSAQLSRKRKKQFIEELKDENDDLRRKEQILRSIPDLVVVFDSTGKLWFVSQSITRFVQFKASELEGKSFWDRLCPESVRLLKAAFMDSLAARESHTDTVPLGNGLWDLRLVDKDGNFIMVTLNGVVHFAGERPECVCCIRPKETAGPSLFPASGAGAAGTEGGVSRQGVLHQQEQNQHEQIPQQQQQHGVVSDMSTAAPVGAPKPMQPAVQVVNGNGSGAIRISDGGNSSTGESESGSSDELNAQT